MNYTKKVAEQQRTQQELKDWQDDIAWKQTKTELNIQEIK